MVDAVLVTGATGFIGRQLLERLQRRPFPVYALVRRTADQTAEERLASLGLQDAVPVEGDLSQQGLGLPQGALAGIRFSHVFHLGALYDITASDDDLDGINVAGTQHLLDWLRERDFDGCFHHVSSIAVAGSHADVFKESHFDVGQTFASHYARTKYESEKLVREAGLSRLRIYRPGSVIGDTQTGAADRADGFYFGLIAIRALRQWFPAAIRIPIPRQGTLPLAPVDFVADAIDAIAHMPDGDGKTFHVFDPKSPSLVRALDVVSQAAGGPRLIEQPGLGRITKAPMFQLLQQTATLKYLRDGLYEDVGLPTGLTDAMPKATFDASELTAALSDTDVSCPGADDYLPDIWSYFYRRLDLTSNPEALRKTYFSGRVAVVTGGSSGIGEAMAYELAAQGAIVVVVARRKEELERVVQEIHAEGGAASYVVADLSDFDQCDAVLAEVIETHGRADVLINNAGRSIRRTAAESLERFHDVERLMQLNYFAPARLIRGSLPEMRKNGFGHIVNILSAGARFPAPRFGAYTATKVALAQLTDTLASELGHENIHVTNAYLPLVQTPMIEATETYDNTSAMSPELAARWVLDAVAQRKAMVAPTIARVGHVLHLLVPKLIMRLMNTATKTYAENPDDFPEYKLDRALVKQIVRGRMI